LVQVHDAPLPFGLGLAATKSRPIFWVAPSSKQNPPFTVFEDTTVEELSPRRDPRLRRDGIELTSKGAPSPTLGGMSLLFGAG
jgi:hypothetical protein